MRKIASIILATSVLLCFSTIESYAFFGIYKNYNPKCKKYDFHCKRTSPKMTKEQAERLTGTQKIKQAEQIEPIEKLTNDRRKIMYRQPKKIFGIFTNPWDNDNPICKKRDYHCKRKSAKIYYAEDESDLAKTNRKDTEIALYTGMFDFSDDKQAAGVFGLEHQNEDLYRDSFVGKISPITGGFLTENSAFYFYSGVQAEYDVGFLTVTPSFAPGYYNSGDGKDLGYPLECKSEVQMSFNLSETSNLGMSYNHISNASLGKKNPGANSYMINFLKNF